MTDTMKMKEVACISIRHERWRFNLAFWHFSVSPSFHLPLRGSFVLEEVQKWGGYYDLW